MRRLGIFAFFAFLMSMCFLKIDDGDGGGGDGDIFDEELDDKDTPPAKDDKKGGDDKKPDDKPPAKETKKDPNDEFIERLKQKEALNEITEEMKAQYGDKFDMKKIVAKLEAMEKENKGSGQALFNKVGIENVFLKHFANEEDGEDGEFDGKSGRGHKAPTDDELIEKINSGKASIEDETAFYKKYM